MQTKTIDSDRQNPMLRRGSKKSQSEVFSTPIDPLYEDAIWTGYKKDIYPLVSAYAQTLMKDSAETEGIVMYAFCRLWDNRKGVTDRSHVLAFLFLVVRSRVVDIVRFRKASLQKH